MDKKKRHLIFNFICSVQFNKNQLKYILYKSIKFNRNIKNKNHIYFYFFYQEKKSSISKLKNICVHSGYKRAIITKLNSSRFIANKLAKVAMLHNYKP